ncbi:MAG: type II secretion system protein GspL, partial [Gammaproteobacteria bacterium]
MSPATETEDGFDLRCEWLMLNEDGRVRAQGEADYRGLSDIIDPASTWMQNPDNIIVTLPSDQLLSLQCTVPGRSSAQIRKALPFVVEEFLTTDIERMHLVNGPIVRGQPVRCHLVDRQLLEDWIACLRSRGIEPGYFLAETDLLPNPPGKAVILLDGPRALVRSLDQSALVDRPNLALALEALAPTGLYLINGALEPAEHAHLDAALEPEYDPWPVNHDSALSYIGSRIGDASAAINVLQGSYRPQRRQTSPLGRWRLGAGLAASWFAAALVMNGVSAFHAGREADRLEAEAHALYRDIFPDVKRI